MSTKLKASQRGSLFGLIVSQFVGAFNDNAWKIMVFTLATRPLLQEPLAQEVFEYSSQMKATVALLVFLFPMLIFSFPAGALADRFSKRSMIIIMKGFEVLLMLLATLSLYLIPTELLFPYILLGAMGMQSALFSPAKYGILPQILPYEKLSKGNGLMEMWTMIAIIAGTGLGPIMLALDKGGLAPDLSWTGPVILSVLSLIGFGMSFMVPKVEPAQKESKGSIETLKDAGRAMWTDRILLLAILGTFFYWFIISLLGQNVLVYAKTLVKHLEKGELLQGLPPASYGIGIALGALIGGKISKDRIEYGLIPFGAIGFAILSSFLGLVQPKIPGTVATLICMGMFSGMLIIPLQSLVQWRAPVGERGAVIALSNALNIGGMIIGSMAAAAMAYLGLDLKETLIASSLFVVGATIWSIKLLPEALTRLVFVILTNTFYKIRIIGQENIPKEGGALLVSNHLSALDAFFVLASVDRPVRFLLSHKHFAKWWLKPFALAMDAIPVPFDEEPEQVKIALKAAARHLKRGHLVCVFPERQVSRTGMMQPFSDDIQEIMEGQTAPIIPIYLDRVWGTVLSPKGGRYIPRRPQNIPHPMTMLIGKPLPPEASLVQIRRTIRKLGCEAWESRKDDEVPIYLHFIRSVWRAPWALSLVDEHEKKHSRISILSRAISLGRILKNRWLEKKLIGVMLPESLGEVLLNLSISISGKTSINLSSNFDSAALDQIMTSLKPELIITTKELYQKNFEALEGKEVAFIEDIMSQIKLRHRLSSSVMGLIFPTTTLEKISGSNKSPGIEDILSIQFTSGAMDRPKAVSLSHFNVSSNVESVSQVIPSTSAKDKLLLALDISNSFGYIAMWIGLNHGLPLVFTPSFLDAKTTARLVKKLKITMLWTTPSILRYYLEHVNPDSFGSLRFVLTAGEKLNEKIASRFKERFGIQPMEGYGTAEMSGIITTNTLDVRLPGIYQQGSQKGSVGQPIPGVMVKVVDPLTFKEVPRGNAGLLLAKGPNLMKGYAMEKDGGNDAFRDGWFITQDVACMDEHDFVTIIDRKTRFLKCGEFFIPFHTIEDLLHEEFDAEPYSFALTSVSDQIKGEKIILVHTQEKLDHMKVNGTLEKNGLFPSNGQFEFLKLNKLPMTNSGKIDFAELKKIAGNH